MVLYRFRQDRRGLNAGRATRTAVRIEDLEGGNVRRLQHPRDARRYMKKGCGSGYSDQYGAETDDDGEGEARGSAVE